MDDMLHGLIANKRDGTDRLVSKKELAARFVGLLTPSYITATTRSLPDGTESVSTVLHKGTPPTITISTAKRSGHPVTVVEAEFCAFGIDPDEVARVLQNQFAGSTTISEISSKKKTLQIFLQGNHTKKMVPFLIEKYMIPVKYFHVEASKPMAPKSRRGR